MHEDNHDLLIADWNITGMDRKYIKRAESIFSYDLLRRDIEVLRLVTAKYQDSPTVHRIVTIMVIMLAMAIQAEETRA